MKASNIHLGDKVKYGVALYEFFWVDQKEKRYCYIKSLKTRRTSRVLMNLLQKIKK